MSLRLLAFGHKLPDWMIAGVNDYLKRIPRDWAFSLTELKPEARDRGRSVAQLLACEAERIASSAGNARRVVLDERGKLWTTQQLAQKLQQWRDAAQDIVFIIGSADGIDPELKRSADKLWSLSPLTLPHGVARLIVVEQIYRAISLLNGHPYHRE